MQRKISRRDLLATTAATAAATTAATVVFATVGFSSAAQAACSNNHKKQAYRLGAQMVDPNLSRADKGKLFTSANCPDCGAGIEPEGLSYSEHMPEWGWGT